MLDMFNILYIVIVDSWNVNKISISISLSLIIIKQQDAVELSSKNVHDI